MNTQSHKNAEPTAATATENSVNEAQMTEAIEDFRIRRGEGEVASADARFFEPILDTWLRILGVEVKEGAPSMSASAPLRLYGQQRRDFIVGVAVAMHECLGMRDAFILSVVSHLGHADLMEAATHAARPATARLIGRTLSQVFRSPTLVPRFVVCQRALDVLIEVNTRIPRSYLVQPLAVLSYLLWWSGRTEEAGGAALRCLSIDNECILAGIVMSALDHDIMPAWKEKWDRR